MKPYIKEFCKRGLMSAGLGPLVLAVVYGFLGRAGIAETMSVEEVCRGIFSITALAFIAGGIGVLYSIERLPLVMALLIHGTVLYVCYVCLYLVNGWLRVSIPVFTVIFVVGYGLIWLVIYSITRKQSESLNRKLHNR